MFFNVYNKIFKTDDFQQEISLFLRNSICLTVTRCTVLSTFLFGMEIV